MSDSASPAAGHHRLFRWITPLLLFLGVQLWLILFHGDYGLTFQRKGLVVCFALSLVPPIARRVHHLLERIRRLSPKSLLILAAILALIATLYFPETAWLQSRSFYPKWQDELSYRIQFRQLAHGRLWYPSHPLADFFDTFQVLVRPVYASIYFPGPSLLYAPALIAHLPLWMMSSLIAGVTAGMLFLLFCDLLDPVAGLLAVFLLLGNTMFRKLALMTFGYPLIVLLAVSAIYFWLRWRKQPSLSRAWPIGVALGWAAITRPLDAIIIAVPIAIDAIDSLRRQRFGDLVRQSALLLAAAAPFLILQIVFNIGVTGKATLTPFELYARRDYPDTTFGFRAYNPAHRPVSIVPQKILFHDTWTAPAVQQHTPANVLRGFFPDGVRTVFDNLMPSRFLILLVPLGLTGLISRPRVLLWLTLPSYMLLYSFYAFSLPQYAMIAEPAVMLLILLGIERATNTWQRSALFFDVFLTSAVILLSLTEMAEFNRYVRDEAFDAPGLGKIETALAELDHKPAIVLFHFPPDGNPHEEPVYNIDVPWPDDAEIIRAHDFGTKNDELFRYYAERQPNRAVYRFDRKDESIAFLGFVKDLAGQSSRSR